MGFNDTNQNVSQNQPQNSQDYNLNLYEVKQGFYLGPPRSVDKQKWANQKCFPQQQLLSSCSAVIKRKFSKNKYTIIATLLLIVLCIYKFSVHYLYFTKSSQTSTTVGEIRQLSVTSCPQKFIINYVWVGDKQKIPQKYAEYLSRCKDNVRLLNQNDLDYYVKLWNEQEKDHQITQKLFNLHKIAQKADMLRKLYLYFESGVYSDFDTEINEDCFDGIITNEIVFTNFWASIRGQQMPEQNFVLVLQKYNPDVRSWIISQIEETQKSWRWNICRIKPCFIINCQKHRYDGTWK